MCSGKSQAEDMQKRRDVKKRNCTGRHRGAAPRACVRTRTASSIARPAEDADEAEEAELAVAHLHGPLEDAAPRRRAQERQQTLGDQHQRDAPSATSQKPTAAKATFSGAAQVSSSPAGAAHRLEEVAARVDDHQVRLVAEGRPIRLEAAIELGELRVLAERLGEDRRRLGVAVALDLLRVAVRLGDDHFALAVGVGADLLALGRAGGAQLVGDLLALGRHAAVDRFGDVADEVDALDADVEDLDAEGLGVVAEAAAHVEHHLVALGREHAADRALGHLLVERRMHDRRQARLEVLHVGAVVQDELARIVDAPLHEPVDDQALLLGREDRPRLGAVERLDATVEEDDVLERRRQLELQAGLLNDFLDLPNS